MITVMNSSPWIFLSGLGIIRLAADLFDELIIPSSVYEEVLRKDDTSAQVLKDAEKDGMFFGWWVKSVDQR